MFQAVLAHVLRVQLRGSAGIAQEEEGRWTGRAEAGPGGGRGGAGHGGVACEA